MIDTLKVLVPCFHKAPIRSRVLTTTDSDGVVIRTVNLPEGAQGLGSHLRVRSRQFVHPVNKVARDGLEIEGSFVKFLNGHNLFGGENLKLLVTATYTALCAGLGDRVAPTGEDMFDIEAGNYRVLRVDLAEMYPLPAGVSGDAWINHAEAGMRHRRKRPSRTADTLYIGKQSSRWSLKLYLKERELAAHPSPAFLPCKEQLVAYSRSTIRAEATLREKELKKRGFSIARRWKQGTGEVLFNDYLNRVTVLGDMPCQDDIEKVLSSAEMRFYQSWRAGTISAAYGAAATRRKYQLRFASLGIDVLAPPPTEARRVNVHAVLQQKPLGVPAFALDQPMLLLGAKSAHDAMAGPQPRATTRLYVRAHPEAVAPERAA